MRTVSRQEVLAAADWLAQYGARLMANSYAHAAGEPMHTRQFMYLMTEHNKPELAEAAMRPCEMAHAEASLLLLSAALLLIGIDWATSPSRGRNE